ncbi:MAG: flagellar biosynthesis protein FlhB [Shimia sp.]|nr:flagellar biosynthesis protein FlhB [Shimia sp.]
MADDQDKSTKTEEPTEKKLRDARRKGDVPNSKETGNMVVVLSLIGIVALILPWRADDLMAALGSQIGLSGQWTIGEGASGLRDLNGNLQVLRQQLLIGIAPMFGLMLLGAVAGTLLQGSTVVALDRIKPKLSKLSPMKGLKRLFSAASLVEFLKNLIKVVVVGTMAVWITIGAVKQVWESPGFLPETLPIYLQSQAVKLLFATAAFLVPIALADMLWRRYEWRNRQRMSHKDIKDEHKESEGSPEIRAKRAMLRRQRSQQRIATAVPLANLVLTNPTHFSVALKYDPAVDIAPVCVAKGADHMARRIRELAHEHGIPMIENKPLTRVLFEAVEVDETVPADHWEVVAEIVGFVMDLEKNVKRRPPDGSVLRTDPN